MSKRARAGARSSGAKRAPKRATTKASLKAARKNGTKGGRPRDKLPKAVADRLGPPPADPKLLREWNARVLAEVQWLCIIGEISAELAATIRAGAGSIDRALPEVKSSGSDDPDDEDDDEDAGPSLTSSPAENGLRVE